MRSFFTPAEEARLLENQYDERSDQDLVPVARLALADDPTSWLITSLKEDNPSIAFGMIDYGTGEEPVIGAINLDDVRRYTGTFGCSVGRDESFTAERPLSYYFRLALERTKDYRREQEMAEADTGHYPDDWTPARYEP